MGCRIVTSARLGGEFNRQYKAHILHSSALMAQQPSDSELAERNLQRRDTLLATVFTVVGLTAVIVAKGGIQDMIAGSVGAVGSGCLAVGLTFLDGRLSYAQRAQASLPIVFMLAGVGVAIHGNFLALAGFPMSLLGLAGLLPAWIHGLQAPAVASRPRIAVSAPALSNS